MSVHEWDIYFFKLFDKQLNDLVKDVIKLKNKDSIAYKKHIKTKLLKRVRDGLHSVPALGPNHPSFLLGKSLGNNNKDWRRIKHPLPSRYRLFFKFSSESEFINYVWLNDENTLRKDGAKTNVYDVFKKMLTKNEVPTSVEELIEKSFLKSSLALAP